jgi:hypothetical protein
VKRQHDELASLRAAHRSELQRLAHRQESELRRLGGRVAALESRSERAARRKR